MPQTFRAVSYLPPGTGGAVFDHAVLMHDQRRVRRRALALVHGDQVLVDFPEPMTLADHGLLRLEDGRLVEVVAAEEELYEIHARDPIHLMQLCWHLGNRHLKVEIAPQSAGTEPRLLILRDHVIRDMLHGLGATVAEVTEPFHPLEGAYHAHGEPAHALLNR